MYQSFIVSSILDIPSTIKDFIESAGWLLDDSNPDAPIFTHPTMVGAVPFQLTAEQAGNAHRLRWTTVGQTPARTCICVAPQLDNSPGSSPVVPAASAVHVFAGTLPQPYICIAIAFGSNRWRHLYCGNMEKVGNYTGGEIISGGSSEPPGLAGAGASWLRGDVNSYLFSSNTSVYGTQRGWLHVVHADEPRPWRSQFYFDHTDPGHFPSTSPNNNYFGGFRDHIEYPFMQRGQSDVNDALTHPINLFNTISDGSDDTTFDIIYLGRPAGVRMVNMQNLNAGDVITVGSHQWRCFPALAKNMDIFPAGFYEVGASNYAVRENSFIVGYAYLED